MKEYSLEQFAVRKRPLRGKCQSSCFANGWHRVGTIPMFSVLDGGIAGDVAMEVCLECGKVFNRNRWFIIKTQPCRLKISEQVKKG